MTSFIESSSSRSFISASCSGEMPGSSCPVIPTCKSGGWVPRRDDGVADAACWLEVGRDSLLKAGCGRGFLFCVRKNGDDLTTDDRSPLQLREVDDEGARRRLLGTLKAIVDVKKTRREI